MEVRNNNKKKLLCCIVRGTAGCRASNGGLFGSGRGVIRDHGCDYKENEGQFSINLTTKEPPTRTFSVIYNFFVEKVKTAFFGSSYKDPVMTQLF